MVVMLPRREGLSDSVIERRLATELRRLDKTSRSMAGGVHELSRFARGVLVYFDEYWYEACSDDCTGPSGAHVGKAIVNYSGVTAGMGAFQPTFDVQWDFCFQKWCLFATESWVKSVVTSHNAGGTVDTKARAVAAAKARAPALFPALPWPKSPCWGKAEPAARIRVRARRRSQVAAPRAPPETARR